MRRRERTETARTAVADSLWTREGWVWCVWLAFALLVVIAKLDTEPSPGNVFHIYRQAGLRLDAGRPLYKTIWFPYSPTAALLFAPFPSLSFAAGGAIWRFLSIAMFAGGARQICRSTATLRRRQLFPWVSLVSMALCWSAARHGQMTLAMAGAMLMGCAELQRENWIRAGGWMAFAVILKPLALVLLLTAAVVHRRMALPALLALTALLLLPFLFQDASYVAEQYEAWPDALRRSAARIEPLRFAQLFTFAETIGISLSGAIRALIRAGLALGTLLVAWQARKRSAVFSVGIVLYAVTTDYTLLLSPVTERNTYAMLGPAIGYFLAEAVVEKRHRIAGFMLAAVLMCLLSSPLSSAFPNTPLSMIKPVVACMLGVFLVHRLWWGGPRSASESDSAMRDRLARAPDQASRRPSP